MTLVKPTLIIPAYNADSYLADCLDSVVCQIASFAEVIITDDASSDMTSTILQQYSDTYDSIVVLTNNANMGVSFSRNRAVNEATSEWVLFLDSDDLLEENAAEVVNNFINSEPAAGLAYGIFQPIDASGKMLSDPIVRSNMNHANAFADLLVRNHLVSTSGILVKRDVFLQQGGFNETLTHGEDWDLWLRLSRCVPFAYLDASLTRIRRHSTNSSGNLDLMLEAARNVLSQYSIKTIANEILSRDGSQLNNLADLCGVFISMENWQAVENILTEYNTIQSDNPELVFYQALLYLHQKDSNDALTLFQRIVAQNPENLAAQNNLAVSYWVNNQPKKAIDIWNTLNESNPEYLDASYNYNHSNEVTFQPAVTLKPLRKTLTRYFG